MRKTGKGRRVTAADGVDKAGVVTLPACVFETRSLRRAAACLLERMLTIAPGGVAGWLALADEAQPDCAPLVCHAACGDNADCRQPVRAPAEVKALLHCAFVRAEPITAPFRLEGFSASSDASSTVTSRRTVLRSYTSCLALPLHARGVCVGSVVLLSRHGRWSPPVKVELLALARAAGTLLDDLQRQERHETQLRQLEKLATLGRTISEVAHELSNPLTGIVGYSERLAQLDPAGSSAIDCARKIGLHAKRAAHAVQDLLAFARPASPERAAVDLNEVVKRAVELMADVLSRPNLTLRLDLAGDLPPILGNASELQQVLENLLSNAADAVRDLPYAGSITVATCALEDGSVKLSVSDNGPGISAEIRDRVLEPFFTTKPIGHGTGLGLAICESIARAHGTCLHLVSEPGQGAGFEIEFPGLSAAAPTVKPPLKTTVRIGGDSDDAGPLRIAVLDDELMIRELLSETLSDMGHMVVCFEQPAELLAQLRPHAFDVVLSDVKMPGMSGMELYAQAIAVWPEAAARIVFLTGDVLATATRTFLERTGVLYLKKPFSLSELADCLDAVRARARKDPSTEPGEHPKAA